MSSEQITSTIKKVILPRRIFAYVNHTGPYMGDSALFERLFTQVMKWTSENGLMQEGAEAITIYHDDPETTPPEAQRISVGFTIPEQIAPDGDIQIMPIQEGNFVVGSFEIFPNEYEEAWNQVYEYIKNEKIHPLDLMYESYRNDPKNHPEGKHIVDICIAVEQ